MLEPLGPNNRSSHHPLVFMLKYALLLHVLILWRTSAPEVPTPAPDPGTEDPDAETDSDHGLPAATSTPASRPEPSASSTGPAEPDREPPAMYPLCRRNPQSTWATEPGTTLMTMS